MANSITENDVLRLGDEFSRFIKTNWRVLQETPWLRSTFDVEGAENEQWMIRLTVSKETKWIPEDISDDPPEEESDD
jgi:hypothetical protein